MDASPTLSPDCLEGGPVPWYLSSYPIVQAVKDFPGNQGKRSGHQEAVAPCALLTATLTGLQEGASLSL